jgi:general secretion pathway protein D
MTTPDGKTMKVNSVNGLINAIAINNNTNVLATPQILTLDNVEGVFESGEKVPVVKSTTTNGTIQNAVEQQTVALTLKITPQINKATRFIKLKIDQKIEDFSTRQLNIPAGGGMGTVIRQLNTTVVCRDKDTIAMGGLMRDKETNTVNKIPLLGDIPILGWLFKNTSRSVEKVNLLFFMTPKILASYEKTNPENVKDLLNRRQAHLKNAIGDDDSFAATAKGIYDKANRQAEGPLYDAKEVAKFQDRNNEEAASPTTELNQTEATEPPNYQDIVKKAETKIE